MTSISIGTMSKAKKMTRRRNHCIQSNNPLATIEERLFFILTFPKNNPTQEYHTAGFDMSQQRCGQWIHTLTTVLRNATDMAGMLPAETLAEFKKILEERGGEKVLHELIHDTTEREIPRPSDPEVQADFYSGKKKKHTKTIAQHLRVSSQIFPTRYSEHLGRVECLIYLPFFPL